MPRFDRYVVVDWSAASRPRTGPDSIWIATAGHRGEPALENPPTRRLAEASLRRHLREATDERTLVCFDAALGYPVGTPGLFGVGVGWRAMWSAITARLSDDDRNRNDRFAVAAGLNRAAGDGPGPFWGCPPSFSHGALTPTKPAVFPIPELRACELAATHGRRRPSSAWQLLGAGSVGSQTLTALPVLERIVQERRIDVWPFTTGLAAPDVRTGGAVVAEAWPTWFTTDAPPGIVRDAHQVATVAARLRSADCTGEIDGWFTPSLDARSRRAVEDEEGWILGVP